MSISWPYENSQNCSKDKSNNEVVFFAYNSIFLTFIRISLL